MAPALLENFWRVTGRRVAGSRRRGLGDPAHVPPTLKGVDPCFIEEWAEGWFTLDGHPVALDGRSPLDVTDAPQPWQRALHGFDWLVDIPLVPEDDLALTFRDLTRAMVADWLARGAGRNTIAARTDVSARRLLSFLAHSDLVLDTADARTYDLYARQIARDAAHLLSEWRTLDDEGRIVALSAVAQAGLACDNGAVMHARAEAALLSELDRQILSDGGHLSRDPRVVPALLLDLIPLRQLYGVADRTAPAMLVATIARMIEFASVLRLGDGQLTRLSGRRAEHDLTLPPLTLLGMPPQRWYGAASGFARVAEGSTVLLVDAGADRSSAGALSFEWSSGSIPVVVSAGDTSVLRTSLKPARRQTHPAGIRATQSTLVIDVPSTAPQSDAPPLPVLAQRQGIDMVTLPGSGTRIDATHAGPGGHGFAHRRVIEVAERGLKIAGQDTLRPLVGPPAERPTALAFHFQLHPDVAVELQHDRASARLTLRDGASWLFSVTAGRISVEDNITVLNGRAIPTVELVVRGIWPEFRALGWVFEAA